MLWKILKSLFTVFTVTYYERAISLITFILLTRWLTPKDFGIVAMATFFATVLGLYRLALDYTLIHFKENMKKLSAAHLLLHVTLAIASIVLFMILLPILKQFFEKEIIIVSIIFVISGLIQSLASTPRTLLEKELIFYPVVLISAIATTLSSITAVIMAINGYGLWALVVGGSIYGFVNVFIRLGIWHFTPIKLSDLLSDIVKLDSETLKQFTRYAGTTWVGELGSIIVFQFDKFLVGVLAGIKSLGFYERAYRIVSLPTETITNITSRVSLPTYANTQKDKIELSRIFSIISEVIISISVGFAILIILLIDPFTKVFLGDSWLPLIPIVRILAVYALFRPVLDDILVFFIATGKAKWRTQIVWILSAMMLSVVLGLTYFLDVYGTAVGVNLVIVAGSVMAWKKVSKILDISIQKIMVGSIISGIFSLILIFAIRLTLGALSPLKSLIIYSCLACFSYILILGMIKKRRLISAIQKLQSAIVNR